MQHCLTPSHRRSSSITSASSIATDDACSNTFPISTASFPSSLSCLPPPCLPSVASCFLSDQTRERCARCALSLVSLRAASSSCSTWRHSRCTPHSTAQQSGPDEPPAPPRASRGLAKATALPMPAFVSSELLKKSTAQHYPPDFGVRFADLSGVVGGVLVPSVSRRMSSLAGCFWVAISSHCSHLSTMDEENRVLLAAADSGQADAVGTAIESLTC